VRRSRQSRQSAADIANPGINAAGGSAVLDRRQWADPASHAYRRGEVRRADSPRVDGAFGGLTQRELNCLIESAGTHPSSCRRHLGVPVDLPQPPALSLVTEYAHTSRVRGSTSTDDGSVSPRIRLHRSQDTPGDASVIIVELARSQAIDPSVRLLTGTHIGALVCSSTLAPRHDDRDYRASRFRGHDHGCQ
jgi:hypothetical protein